MRIASQPQPQNLVSGPMRRRIRHGRYGRHGRHSHHRRRGTTAVVAGVACALVLAAGPFPAQAEEAVPTPEALSQALLEPSDIGPGVVRGTDSTPDDDRNDPTGCAALDGLRDARSPDTADPWPEVRLRADTVIVQEKLIAGQPEAVAAGHAMMREALTSCPTLSFPAADGAPPLTLNLSPVAFGGPEAVAMRMEGTYSDVPINGYLVLEPLGAVEVLYVCFQVGEDSTQAAAAIYAIAVDKVHRVIGPAAGPPQPLTTPTPGQVL